MKSRPKLSDASFILLLIVISWLYNFHTILFHGPWLPHMWRQADCLSITTNYFKDNLNFFTPAVHWTGPEGHGRTMSEFPIIYFTVGKLWALFGKHYFIYRIINIILVFSGLFSLYKISNKFLNDRFWAFFVPVFVFSSSALVFYTNNFLSNAPAFGLALTASYFYLLFRNSKQKKWLVASVVAFTLAGLLKITSLIIFVAFFAFEVLQLLRAISKKQIHFLQACKRFIPYLIVVAVIAAWYTYARDYNSKNVQNIFLQGLYPIWDLNQTQIKEVLDKFYHNILPSFFNRNALLVILVLFVADMVFLIKKGQRELTIVAIIFAGVLLYLTLWFKALDQHDYYLINLLILIPAVLLGFLFELKQRFFAIFKNPYLKTIAAVFVILLITQTMLVNRIKYNVNDPFLKVNNITKTLDEEDFKYWNYKQNKYAETLHALESITPYLRELGIHRDDLVVSIPDVSINISLVLMDQKGFTDYGYSENKGKIHERMENFKRIGAKYLIVNDANAINRKEFDEYTQHQIGEYQNVKIYKL